MQGERSNHSATEPYVVSQMRHVMQHMLIFTFALARTSRLHFQEGLVHKLFTNTSNSIDCINAIENKCVFRAVKDSGLQEGCRKCETLLQIYIWGRYTSVCFIHSRNRVLFFWTSHYVVPWSLFVWRNFFLHLPLRLIWDGNPGFPPFSGTNRAHKLVGVEKGVIERDSVNQHDALRHHFEIEHICDGTITIALIIDIGNVTSSRSVIVPPHVP